MKVFLRFFLSIHCLLGYMVYADNPNVMLQLRCCKPPPCPFDVDTVYKQEGRCSKHGKCRPSPDRCDPPAHQDVPPVFYPNVDDVLPKFTSSIVNNEKQPMCAATIISNRFLMTACKMCLIKGKKQIRKDMIQVLIGEFDEFEDYEVHFRYYQIQRIIIHSNCYKGTTYNAMDDIGVLQTNDPIHFNEFQHAAELAPPTYKPKSYINWFISTFRANNKISYNPYQSIWSIKVRHIVDSAVCNAALNNSANHDSTHNICAAYHHPDGEGICNDDFGLPLWEGRIVFGILTFKYGCGRIGSAGSYVSVSRHYEWLLKVMK